jgi:hypothetical protein
MSFDPNPRIPEDVLRYQKYPGAKICTSCGTKVFTDQEDPVICATCKQGPIKQKRQTAENVSMGPGGQVNFNIR